MKRVIVASIGLFLVLSGRACFAYPTVTSVEVRTTTQPVFNKSTRTSKKIASKRPVLAVSTALPAQARLQVQRELQQKLAKISPQTLKAVQVNVMQGFHNISDFQIENAATLPSQVSVSAFPIRSPLLTPGKVVTRAIKGPLVRPIFLIGSGVRSINWLLQNAKRLENLKARGFVVNVKNAQVFKRLQAVAPLVPLMPMPGDALAKQLGLKYIPVLINSDQLSQ